MILQSKVHLSKILNKTQLMMILANLEHNIIQIIQKMITIN